MHLTGRLALVIGLGVVPVVLLSAAGVPAWAVTGGWLALCVLVAGVDIAQSADPKAVRVERDIPARALRDERVTTRLLLHNTGARILRGRVRDGWQPTAGAPSARPQVTIPPGERRAVVIPLHPRRRGELRTGFVAIRTFGPFGLAGRQAALEAPGALRVLPPFRSRRHLLSRLARLRELDGNTSVQVRGAGTEFDSLREYVRGDDVRSIDWRATARAGTTMLRTWRPERDRHVVIVIDTGRTSAARVGDGVRLDAAMEASLLLAALAARAGDHIHLILFDRLLRGRVTRTDGARLLPAMVEAMAPVEPQLIDTDWTAAIAQIATLTSRPSLVVLLTAQDSPDAARGFLGSFAAMRGDTHVLVGTATDLRERPPAGAVADDVYLDAAQERAARDAERVAAAVRRASGEAITAPADELPPRVADRSLALKANGLL
ncbi:DUF58 domain-containing protein [Microbacterium sp.]|uniref:DUF58 domain-containing protein n=1 Tax=Microbacterium sp. TaxID=51671 RepID=UPI003A89915E